MLLSILTAVFPILVFSATLPPSQLLANSDPRLSTPFVTDLLLDSTDASHTTIDLTNTQEIPFSLNTSLSAHTFNSSSSVYDHELGADIDANAQCKGGTYGTNLVKASCAGAVARILQSSELLIWGQRGQGDFNLKLPYRYLCMWTDRITSC